MAYVSKSLGKEYNELEGILCVLSYCLSHLHEYVAYCPSIEVCTPLGGMSAFYKAAHLGSRLAAMAL